MRDKIIGSLLGLAAGDCLGAPVEGQAPGEIRRHFGVLRDFQFDAPIWTDDTQQALVLVEATVRTGRPDPEWVGRRFVEMSHPRTRGFGCHRGTGRGFRASVDAFEADGDWRTSGQLDRAGNGAAMRIAPVGAALHRLEDREFVRTITEVSMLTHREPRSIAGALAVARLAAQLVDEPAYPLRESRATALLGGLADWLRECESWLAASFPELRAYRGDAGDLSRVLGRLHERWGDGWPSLEQEIVSFASARQGERTYATAGYVLCSVPTAILQVLLARDSLEEALIRTVNFGGDADTVAAMVGGMAGAAAGEKAIPPRWRSFAGHDELFAWAAALATHASGQPVDVSDLPELVALERDLCARLWGT